jgi:NADH-quinone oxidoreductase subunit M
MMGVFVALDFFLFFIFWEVMLLPMYFLIGIWGGRGGSMPPSSFFSIPFSAAA